MDRLLEFSSGDGESEGIGLPQSIPITGVLAAFGGILEVFATAVLAYPAARIAEGQKWTDKHLKVCLSMNIILQILASLSGNLFATWFGPVAIVGPIFFAAQLLANLVVFWIVLGLEAFSREMQIGTYVIVVAVVLLIVTGPGPQDYGDTTFQELINEPYAMIWAWILFLSMMVSGVIVIVDNLHQRQEYFRLLVLLVARASAFTLNLSTGKAVVLPTNQFWLIVNICIKVISGIIYTRAIVVQSTAVQQRVFVPINAALIVVVNAITGIIIWEDWKVVQLWVGYICVFFLLALGCGLLLGDLGLLQETAPETFLGARASMFVKEERIKVLDNLKQFGNNNNNNASSGPRGGGRSLMRQHSLDKSNYLQPSEQITLGDCPGQIMPQNNESNDAMPTKEVAALSSEEEEREETNPLNGSRHAHNNNNTDLGTTTTTSTPRVNNTNTSPVASPLSIDERPIPMRTITPPPRRRQLPHRQSLFQMQRDPKSRQAWASIYGQANAAPRLSVVSVASGDGRYSQAFRWSTMEQSQQVFYTTVPSQSSLGTREDDAPSRSNFVVSLGSVDEEAILISEEQRANNDTRQPSTAKENDGLDKDNMMAPAKRQEQVTPTASASEEDGEQQQAPRESANGQISTEFET